MYNICYTLPAYLLTFLSREGTKIEPLPSFFYIALFAFSGTRKISCWLATAFVCVRACIYFFFYFRGNRSIAGVSHSDAWKWPKGMRQPWSMLHPIGVYRNCPSNNIFIASGWLNTTLGNHPRDPAIASTPPCPTRSRSFVHRPPVHPPQCAVHPHANRLSNNYRKYTRGRLAALFFSSPVLSSASRTYD